MSREHTAPSSDVKVPEGFKSFGNHGGFVYDHRKPGVVMEFSTPATILSAKQSGKNIKVRIPFKRIKGGKKMHKLLYDVDDKLKEFADENEYEFISFFRPIIGGKGKLDERASLVITIPEEMWEEDFPEGQTLETIIHDYKINLLGNYKFGVAYVYKIVADNKTLTGLNIQPQKSGPEEQQGSISFTKFERNSGKRKKEEEEVDEE